MNIEINFSATPYRQVQSVLLRRRLILITLSVTFSLLMAASVRALVSWSATRAQASGLRSQIAREDGLRSRAEAFLNRPDSRRTRQAAEFLNAAFARRAFSWTELFADLEPVVPPRVHVTSIRPEFTADGRVELHLAISSSAKDGGVDLVRRLEHSPRFAQAQIVDERQQEDRSAGSTLQFNISALYIPGFMRTRDGGGAVRAAPGESPADQPASRQGARSEEASLARH